MKIAVVYDRSNLERSREVMVFSVYEALSKKYDVELLAFEDRFFERINRFDFVFNLSTASRQLHVPAVLELLKIPYTGSDPLAHAICIDKVKTKIILSQCGVPTAPFVAIEPNELVPQIDFYPAIVKPSREGSAKGLSKDSVVNDYDSLRKKVQEIHQQFRETALVERFIDGREFSVGILENEVLPILEIDFSSLPPELEKFYSHRVKHEYGEQTRYICPAQIDRDLEKQIKDYALKTFKILGLRDYARIDLRVKDDQIYFLEVNSLPMLTPNYSDIIKMAQAAGYSYEELIYKILDSAKKRVS
ncbi:D-alanine--D-alanine ligase family protein [Pseudothermotoga sp. U03pept]|uniref:D-alanine--D-alanine ligase family protein n=1 Tax=Pseudothermotoga sp. U03pept TaxID=3447012 RepID=UPI003F11FE01